MERVNPKKPRVANFDVIAVRVADLDERARLLAARPAAYFTEPHYEGFPAVLVRLEAVSAADLKALIKKAWQCRAPRTSSPPGTSVSFGRESSRILTMSRFRRSLTTAVAAGVAAAALATASTGAHARVSAREIPAAPLAAPASCESLSSLKLPHTTITTSSLVEAGQFSPPASSARAPAGTAFASLPAFCRVAATLTPSSDSDIKIEVWMPASGWNGKFQGVGNGGWDGNIVYPALAAQLARGYAAASTDTGHTGGRAEFALAIQKNSQISPGVRCTR